MSITIRQIEKDDLNTWTKLVVKNDYYIYDKTIKRPVLRKRYEDYFQNDEDGRHDTLHHICVDGKKIGNLAIRYKGFHEELQKNHNWVWITTIMIDEDYRGKGIGTKVFDMLKEKYSQDEWKHIDFISVDIDITQEEYTDRIKPLIKWYKSMGFTPDKINPDDGNLLLEYRLR
jgi:GNAT superfamily N-acetyltransferase